MILVINSRQELKWWSQYMSVDRMVILILDYHCTGHLNSKPFDKQTNPHDLNTKLWFAIQNPTPLYTALSHPKINPLCAISPGNRS